MKEAMRRLIARFDGVLWILHPLLLYFYSVLFLLTENQVIPIQAMLRSLLLGFFIILVLLVIGRKLFDGPRAALLVSGVIILFFSFGHLINLIERYLGKTFDEIGEWLFFIPGFLVVVLWIYYVLKRIRQVGEFTRYFFIVGIIVNLFPIQSQVQSNRYADIAQQHFLDYQQELEAKLEFRSTQIEESAKRDVYYIVLDAYGRADVLLDLYDYDNSEFIQFLESRGFYVAHDSHSNYDDTELSISSSLNMSYLSGLPETLGAQGGVDEETVKSFAAKLLGTNVLQSYFHDLGYTIIAFESGYPSTVLDDADIFLQSPSEDRGSSWRVGFETMLLDSSLGRLLMKIFPKTAHMLDWLFDLHRERILYAFEHLPDYTEDIRPTFIFAHIISPHTPYVFGADGERIDHQDPFSLLDARPGNPDNKQYYSNQVQYISQLAMEVIDNILQTSTVEPIIILQADHGSKVYMEKEPSPEMRCRLNLPILNAYYFPDVDAQTVLYPSISPVNSFRVLLNEYFQEELPLLPDESYKLLEYAGELQFVDFEIAFAACP
jgi:hypothetical protein